VDIPADASHIRELPMVVEMALGMAMEAALFQMARTLIEQQEYKLVWSNSINFSIFIYVFTAIAY